MVRRRPLPGRRERRTLWRHARWHLRRRTDGSRRLRPEWRLRALEELVRQSPLVHQRRGQDRHQARLQPVPAGPALEVLKIGAPVYMAILTLPQASFIDGNHDVGSLDYRVDLGANPKLQCISTLLGDDRSDLDAAHVDDDFGVDGSLMQTLDRALQNVTCADLHD